jgi:hypothetical protein
VVKYKDASVKNARKFGNLKKQKNIGILEKERQCACNVKLRRFRVTIVAMKINKPYVF